MQSEHYRNSLVTALENLRQVNASIFDTMVGIMLQGGLCEWSRSVPVGESHQFEFSIFKNSDDSNIQLLVKTLEYIDQTYESICNLNGIRLNEDE